MQTLSAQRGALPARAAQPQLRLASRRGRTLLVQPRAQAGPSRLDKSPQPTLERLERMYASTSSPSRGAPRPAQPPAAAAASAVISEAGEARPHAVHVTEVCGHSGSGLHICVEHTIDDETGEEVPAAEPLEGAAGVLARLMDKIPLSRRARGIVMLNLLVLLVATNWVSELGAGGWLGAPLLRPTAACTAPPMLGCVGGCCPGAAARGASPPHAHPPLPRPLLP